MPLRRVALVASVCLTAGWLLASVMLPPVAELQTLPLRESQSPSPAATNQTPYTRQLQLRLGQAPAAPTPRRNPFVFGARARSAPPAGVTPQPAESNVPSIVTSMPDDAAINLGPSLRLLGIGSTQTPEGAVRTAVLSDGRSVHLVRAGQVIAGYAVVEVTEDGATLADAAGAQWKLKLK